MEPRIQYAQTKDGVSIAYARGHGIAHAGGHRCARNCDVGGASAHRHGAEW